jgi:organic hydroperoxide reductase OsmC/OhrA
MASHKATITWERGDSEFKAGAYSHDHRWDFEGGESLAASAAPAYRGNPALVDPEQGFVASLSSCHMLTFLAMAAAKGMVVDRYSDEAEGFIGKNDQGRMAVTRVVLRPRVSFAGDAPDETTLEQLHERAHKMCFIANSVSCPVDVE